MILYRLQDKYGRGPWEGCDGAFLYNASCMIGELCSTMPTPKDDDGPEFREHFAAYGVDGWYFACASFEQLIYYFPCEYGRAAMEGYEIVVLECPRVFTRVGNTQVIYRPERATITQRLDRVTLQPKESMK